MAFYPEAKSEVIGPENSTYQVDGDFLEDSSFMSPPVLKVKRKQGMDQVEHNQLDGGLS